MARIVNRTETSMSPWVRLVEITVEPAPGRPVERYHALGQADYVTIVARTPSGRIPIVRQLRPAVGTETWELPGGLLEDGELPELCCGRELREEAGMDVLSIRPLGSYFPDTGRLANRIHFFAVDASEPDPAFAEELGVELVLVTPDELRTRIFDGSFAGALQIAALACASLQGVDLGLF
jgi:ADP-ribose pyrophosphatase